jgi:hypothetical protein
MTDYGNFDDFSEYDMSGPNYVVEIDNTEYLVQGEVDDQITMFRPVSKLLECERNPIQKVLLGDTE